MTIATLSSGYLVILSCYHVVSGGLSFFAPELAMRFYRRLYGCDPDERRTLMLVLRPWGALAVFAGLAGFLVFVVPAARSWIVASLAVLLLMRIGYRVALRRELEALSRISPKRNVVSLAFLVAGVLILITDLVQAGLVTFSL